MSAADPVPAPPHEPPKLPPAAEAAELTVARIAAAQRPLSAYIRSLTLGWGSSDDVLQEVNLVLWRKAAEFDGRGEFLTWACRVAYLQVLAHRKRQRQDRTVQPTDEAVLADLAEPAAERVGQLDQRLDALRACLSQLPEETRQLLADRYAEHGSVRAAADRIGRTAESVRVTLHRVRRSLLDCVRRRLAVREAAP